jgi:putative aldouronate transport system permease protein
VVLLILRSGGVLGVGFEKIYLMQNARNLTNSEVISTYVYKMGLINAQYSFSAAVSFFNTVVNFIILITVNQIARRVSENSLW